LDKEKPEIIKFKFANSDHEDLVVGTNLEAGSGIAHGVFDEAMTTANQAIDTEKEGAEDVLKQF